MNVAQEGTAPTPAARAGKALPATSLLVLLLVDGFLAGGLLGGRVFASGPGFDALGSALGGGALGLLAALVLWLALASRFAARELWRCVGGAALLLLALVGVVLAIRRAGAQEPDPEPAQRPKTSVPAEGDAR